jgi:hypothetical protein
MQTKAERMRERPFERMREKRDGSAAASDCVQLVTWWTQRRVPKRSAIRPPHAYPAVSRPSRIRGLPLPNEHGRARGKAARHQTADRLLKRSQEAISQLS